ncbi:MAG: hypothetical protein IH897_05100 [Planctomycetes bacterium]|nr:hypothetical protein [Planctomycetota bacterium]
MDGTVNYAPYASKKITQSSVDTSKLAALATSIDTLAQSLIDNVTALSHVDLENEHGDFVWTTRGYTNLDYVHDGNTGTSASTGSAINQDHVTVNWPVLRFVDRVEIFNALGIASDTQLEYTTDGTVWQLLTTGLTDGDGEYAVKRMVKGKAPWPQIVAGPAENNPIAMKYFVAGIPATFLIDYEGKVVAKDLRGADLRREVRRQVKRARAASSKVTANLDQDGKARIITK